MANVNGVSYLDLSGNRIVWFSGQEHHSTIVLFGSNFHGAVALATLAISGFCLLAFFGILLGLCFIYCGQRNTRKHLPWPYVWIPVICMIGFFGTDISNRVMHELQKIVPSEYIAIDIGIGTFGSIADGALMTYLWNKSPVTNAYAGRLSKLIMLFAIIIFGILSTTTKGTQGWSIFEQIDPSKSYTSSDADTSDDDIHEFGSQVTAQDLNTAAVGVQLLFAIGYGVFATRFLTKRSAKGVRKGVAVGVFVLSVTFLLRNVLFFVFTLLYSQFNHTASMGIQLIYLACYGLLSIVIYISVLTIASMQEKEQPSVEGSRVEYTPDTAYYGASERLPEKQTYSYTATSYPPSYGYQGQYYNGSNFK